MYIVFLFSYNELSNNFGDLMNTKQRKMKSKKRKFHNRKMPALYQGQLVELLTAEHMPDGAKIGQEAIVVFAYPKQVGRRAMVLVVHPEWDGHTAQSADHCFSRITDSRIMDLINDKHAWFINEAMFKPLKKMYK